MSRDGEGWGGCGMDGDDESSAACSLRREHESLRVAIRSAMKAVGASDERVRMVCELLWFDRSVYAGELGTASQVSAWEIVRRCGAYDDEWLTFRRVVWEERMRTVAAEYSARATAAAVERARAEAARPLVRVRRLLSRAARPPAAIARPTEPTARVSPQALTARAEVRR